VLIHLPDGTPLTVRPIRPADRRLLANGLQRLSDQTVQRRFLTPKPSFSSRELTYLTEVDGQNHVALVAEPPAGSPGGPLEVPLVAVGRFVRLADEPETAEVAIVVADPYQGKGLGTQLGLMLADEARALGIRRFSATMSGDNVPALRLLEKLSRRLQHGPLLRSRSGSANELLVELAA
jgi:RimJ/RimL family protein N-acetyltransferase